MSNRTVIALFLIALLSFAGGWYARSHSVNRPPVVEMGRAVIILEVRSPDGSPVAFAGDTTQPWKFVYPHEAAMKEARDEALGTLWRRMKWSPPSQ
jgi:hypothetical protein